MVRLRAGLAALAALVLCGCSVGPKYSKPSVPAPPAYKEPPPDSFKETKGWKAAAPGTPAEPAHWWEIFGDSQLNALEQQVIAANQSLKAAEARFREARALIRFNRAAQFPTISTAPSIASVRDSQHRPYLPPSAVMGRTGDFLLPFDLSWELDLWGRVRRRVAAAREETQATAADLAAVRLSLQAELAFDYFELRSADAQRQLLDDTVKAYTDALQLTVHRFEGGAAPKSDVAQAQTQLDATRVQATDVGVQRAAFEHAIAVLTGQPPASFSLAPLPLRIEPPGVPVGLPSELLERRPDIRRAADQLAAATARVGEAKADFFPKFSLTGAAGRESTQLDLLPLGLGNVFSFGPSLSLPIFTAGRIRANVAVQEARVGEAAAVYRSTVLTALEETKNALVGYSNEQDRSERLQRVIRADRTALELARAQYRAGLADFLTVLDAERTLSENEDQLAQSQTAVVTRLVSLYKALGGGWSAAP